MSPDTRERNTHAAPVDMPAPAPVRTSFPWRRLVFGVAILIFGFALGVSSAVLFRHEILRLMRPKGGPPAPRPLQERLAEQLSLSEDQQALFNEIYERHWNTMLAAYRAQNPVIEQEWDALRVEVDAILTDPQKEEWKQAFARMQFFVPVRLAMEATKAIRPEGDRPERGGRSRWPDSHERKERKR